MTSWQYRYVTPQGKPCNFCPECGGDWRTEGGVEIELYMEGAGNWTEESSLDEGRLVDPYGHVAEGLHSLTTCGHCDARLMELPGVREVCEEEDD